jgi:hypothetical protein
MGKSATYEAAVLNLLLNGIGISGIADNTATSPLTNLYVALHTADPTVTGTQATSEISYTGYARVAVARNSTTPAWTITGSGPAVAHPNAAINWPVSTGGTGGTATFFSIGGTASGAGEIFYSGPISPGITVASGVAPELTTASTVSES